MRGVCISIDGLFRTERSKVERQRRGSDMTRKKFGIRAAVMGMSAALMLALSVPALADVATAPANRVENVTEHAEAGSHGHGAATKGADLHDAAKGGGGHGAHSASSDHKDAHGAGDPTAKELNLA